MTHCQLVGSIVHLTVIYSTWELICCLSWLTLDLNYRSLYHQACVCLRSFACFALFLIAGPTTLFMNLPTCKKYVNSVLPFKNYFATVFSVISFQFSVFNKISGIQTDFDCLLILLSFCTRWNRLLWLDLAQRQGIVP